MITLFKKLLLSVRVKYLAKLLIFGPSDMIWYFSLELDEGNIIISPVLRQLHWLPVQRRVDFKLAYALSSPRCPARHLRTWPTTYTWSRKVLDAGFTRPPTDRAPFHAHTTHLATEALLLPGHVFGTASQHTCSTKTLLTTVSGVNLRRIGFNVASGAQCDVLLNCAIYEPIIIIA